jgi:hypothetical protein
MYTKNNRSLISQPQAMDTFWRTFHHDGKFSPEIFGSRGFTQIRPVWVGDLGTRPKNSKF